MSQFLLEAEIYWLSVQRIVLLWLLLLKGRQSVICSNTLWTTGGAPAQLHKTSKAALWQFAARIEMRFNGLIYTFGPYCINWEMYPR